MSTQPREQLRIFVSHSQADHSYCRALVTGLRAANADVWYDEHNLGSGQLTSVIQRELNERPVVIGVLSRAAFASSWVRRELMWAYELVNRDPSRALLLVTADSISRDDFSGANGWLFLYDFKRIEAPNFQPFPPEEAVRRALRELSLTSTTQPPEPASAPPPPPDAGALDALAQGKTLRSQGRFEEAIDAFKRATTLDPRVTEAWSSQGQTLFMVGRFQEAVAACEHALALDPNLTSAWTDEGFALCGLGRHEAGIVALDRALTLDPTQALVWGQKGDALVATKRYQEAVEAYDRALALDAAVAAYHAGKGNALNSLGQYQEALSVSERALQIDATDVLAWACKGNALSALGRTQEAEVAFSRAMALDPHLAVTRKAATHSDAAPQTPSSEAVRPLADAAQASDTSSTVAAREPRDSTRKGTDMTNSDNLQHLLWEADQLIAVQSENPEARSWDNKGAEFVKQDRYQEALAAFDRAIAIDPKYAMAWCDKGTALVLLRRLDEAVTAYDRALALYPDFVRALLEKGKVQEARALLLGKQFESAWLPKTKSKIFQEEMALLKASRAAFERVLALDPSNEEAAAKIKKADWVGY